MEEQKIRPIDVAQKWGISHIKDVDDHSKWQLAFVALGNATITLRETEKQMSNMAKIIANSVTEIQVYEKALRIACAKADLNQDELLQKILSDITKETESDVRE